MEKRIVLCADDYGQAPAISQGILKLLERGRLSAVSCLVNTPYWQEEAAWLRPYAKRADIGLHFNLTEGQPVSAAFANRYGDHFPSLSQLMRLATLRRLKTSIVEAELNAQLDRFINTIGFMPRFIDGHQHIHQFPVVRTALINVYNARLKEHQPYIRLVNPELSPLDILLDPKKVIIVMMGTHALKKLLITNNIPHNISFSGIYNFAKAAKYPELFQNFLRQVEKGGLIMCHPGLPSAKPDPISQARHQEFHYFSSPQFLSDCEEQNVKCTRGSFGLFGLI